MPVLQCAGENGSSIVVCRRRDFTKNTFFNFLSYFSEAQFSRFSLVSLLSHFNVK